MAALTLTQQDNGRLVNVAKGSEILLSLPENPTTGFRWQLDDLAGHILESGESMFEPRSNAAGAAGVRLFHFKVIGEGETKVRAKHWRQWEGDSSVTERFEVTVKVAH